MPAIIAASSSVTSFARLPKYSRAAASTPCVPCPKWILIAVEGENLALRVSLLDLNRDEDLLDLALRTLIAERESDLFGKQAARELHGQRAGARDHPPAHDVAAQPNQHRRDAQPEMIVEVLVLGGNDRVPKVRRDVFVGNDEAPLDRKFSERLAIRGIDAGDGARRVIVESGNEREVAGVGEQHPAQDSQQRDADEQDRESGVPGKSNDVGFGGLSRPSNAIILLGQKQDRSDVGRSAFRPACLYITTLTFHN